MNEKERVKRCISFEETDKVPWQIDCTTQMAERFVQYRSLAGGKPVSEREGYHDTHTFLNDCFGNHLCYVRTERPYSAEGFKPGILRDEWGVLWDRSIDRDIGIPINTVLEGMDLSALKVPDPLDPVRYANFELTISANPHRYLIAKISRCLFERAWSLRGMQNLLIDFKQNPAFVHELFGAITEFNLKVLERLGQFPVDGVRFADDWGGQQGLLMSPDTWRSFIRPYLARMYQQAHRQGYDVLIHSCGNISALLDDLIEIGVNVFNPLQPEAMDIESVMVKHSGRLAFWGGLSLQKTLPFGTPQEVKKEVRHRLELGRKFGGYIVAPSHDMPPDVPLENIEAMVEVLKEQPEISLRSLAPGGL